MSEVSLYTPREGCFRDVAEYVRHREPARVPCRSREQARFHGRNECVQHISGTTGVITTRFRDVITTHFWDVTEFVRHREPAHVRRADAVRPATYRESGRFRARARPGIVSS